MTASEKLKKELERKAHDLEVLNESLVGREIKMVQMQNEISKLKNTLQEKKNDQK